MNKISQKSVKDFIEDKDFFNMDEFSKILLNWDETTSILEDGPYYEPKEFSAYNIVLKLYIDKQYSKERFELWIDLVRGSIVGGMMHPSHLDYNDLYMYLFTKFDALKDLFIAHSKKTNYFIRQLIKEIDEISQLSINLGAKN